MVNQRESSPTHSASPRPRPTTRRDANSTTNKRARRSNEPASPSASHLVSPPVTTTRNYRPAQAAGEAEGETAVQQLHSSFRWETAPLYVRLQIETKGSTGNAFRTTDFFMEPDGFECNVLSSETGQDMSDFVSGIMREHEFELHDHNNTGTCIFTRGSPPESLATEHVKSKRKEELEPLHHNYSIEVVLKKSSFLVWDDAPNLGSLKCRVLDLLVRSRKTRSGPRRAMVPSSTMHQSASSSSSSKRRATPVTDAKTTLALKLGPPIKRFDIKDGGTTTRLVEKPSTTTCMLLEVEPSNDPSGQGERIGWIYRAVLNKAKKASEYKDKSGGLVFAPNAELYIKEPGQSLKASKVPLDSTDEAWKLFNRYRVKDSSATITFYIALAHMKSDQTAAGSDVESMDGDETAEYSQNVASGLIMNTSPAKMVKVTNKVRRAESQEKFSNEGAARKFLVRCIGYEGCDFYK